MDTPWDGKLPKSEEEKKNLCLFLKLKSELGTTLNEQKFSKKEISSPSACKLRITFEGQEELISKRGIRRLRKNGNLLNLGMKTVILSPSTSMIKERLLTEWLRLLDDFIFIQAIPEAELSKQV